MGNLPTPNPIDAGYLGRGGAVDHLGSKTIRCGACDSEQKAEIYKMIMGRSGGFGAPVFVKPFQKRSSTRGKLGRKGVYALCCKCASLWSQDDGARESLTSLGFDPDGIIPAHMTYEMINRAAEETLGPTNVGTKEQTQQGRLSPTSKVRKLDPEVVAAPEETETPEAQQSEVVEAAKQSKVRKLEPEVAEQPSKAETNRLGAKPVARSTNPAVEADPEVVRLRERLAAAEREIGEETEERRRAEELEQLQAETAAHVKDLSSQLEKAEAELAEVRARRPEKVVKRELDDSDLAVDATTGLLFPKDTDSLSEEEQSGWWLLWEIANEGRSHGNPLMFAEANLLRSPISSLSAGSDAGAKTTALRTKVANLAHSAMDRAKSEGAATTKVPRGSSVPTTWFDRYRASSSLDWVLSEVMENCMLDYN